MPVKRSLKLDDQLDENSFDPSKIMKKKSVTYSPTTGTCQMSPFSSPTSSKEQEFRNEPSNGKRKKKNHLSLTERKKSTGKDNDTLMVLLSEVETSSEEIVEIIQNLSNIQALEGNRELENLIGISVHASCFLKREVEKTKELVTKVTKHKLFEKKSSVLLHKGFWPIASKDNDCESNDDQSINLISGGIVKPPTWQDLWQKLGALRRNALLVSTTTASA